MMKLRRRMLLNTWDEESTRVTVEYLKRRGFADAGISGDGTGIVGSRGSWLGNFTSFDMTKLRAKIQISSTKAGDVRIELDVNTIGQVITRWNVAVWRLELIELRQLLCGLGPIDDIWSRFAKDDRSAAAAFAVSSGLRGHSLVGTWEAELSEFESCSFVSL